MRERKRSGETGWRRRFAALLAALVPGVAVVVCPTVSAFNIDTGDYLKTRLDITTKYSATMRTENADPSIISNPNFDDGDRAVKRWNMPSNRFDLVGDFEIQHDNFGFTTSGEYWYDLVYQKGNQNNSQPTYNGIGPSNQYVPVTRRIMGRDGQLLNAFFFGEIDLGNDTPLSVRVGRHALIWGESLFAPDNGIAYGMGPLDFIKSALVPNSEAKEIFLPTNQVSFSLQLSQQFEVEGFYQLEWAQVSESGGGQLFRAL